MKTPVTLDQFRQRPLYVAMLGGVLSLGAASGYASTNPCAGRRPCAMLIAAANNPCNPCAAKNPCAMRKMNPCNPCAAKNPCAMKKGYKKKMMNPCNPCAAKNPCGMKKMMNPCNPCAANPCNPCAAKNPCGMKKTNPCNPCAAKNPCNPCAAKNPCNPCAAKSPCGAAKVNPCAVKRPAGTRLATGNPCAMLALGQKLWNDKSLSKSGTLSCAVCHDGNKLFNPTFRNPYPHQVKMANDMAGLRTVSVDEMVQLCMVVPMGADPLPWNSKELAALSAYTQQVQKTFMLAAADNPCNPCAAKNPCGMGKMTNPCNPCAARNPCAMQKGHKKKMMNPCNPCAAKNPCAMKMKKNPCNPCAANPCAAKSS